MSESRIPTVRADELAWITEADMIEVDRIMIEDLHIELIQMMENAGRRLAELVVDRFAPSTVAVIAGSGGNGGGGLVAARHLTNLGVEVSVTTARTPSTMSAVPAHQLDILERMGVAQRATPPAADVLVDAVIGYSLRGAPRGASETLIRASAAAGTVVALDTPSGLDVTTGGAPGAVVHADATVTLALPKVGLRDAEQVGALYLADISVPSSVTAAFGASAPEFGARGVLQIV